MPRTAPLAEEEAVAREIARLSTEEITAAVRATNAPLLVRRAISALASKPSTKLGTVLARFDARIKDAGLGRAAREVVSRLGAKVDVTGECPAKGPALVVTNHPGAYDALALMGSLGRDDVALIATDRVFLRAMPNLAANHLVFVSEKTLHERARGLLRAIDWLAKGHVLVQFGAGAIEPDVRFDSTSPPLGTWHEGTGVLAARAPENTAIVPCFIAGVHSPRAKELFFVKWAEARGITTIAPLVQATMSDYRDVEVTIRLGRPIPRTECQTDQIRAAVLALSKN